MDLIVTTPKAEMASAAREAAECLAAGGGEYFRRFPLNCPPFVGRGNRIYYVEDGFIRGFGLVNRVERLDGPVHCDTTGRAWPPGFYVFLRADSWQWIRPIPMRGFQGYRYAQVVPTDSSAGWLLVIDGKGHEVLVVGTWRDPKPLAGP